MSPIDISKIILLLSEPEKGDIISNLKLQKLLYYVQGFHLAVFGKPLFDESIEAWQYGPVCPAVYHHYKDNGSRAIDIPEEFDVKELGLSDEQIELIIDVYKIYGQYSAVRLMEMTHSEPPWLSTPLNATIEHNILNDYFKTQIVK